jgi:hypothetical protein
MRCIGRAVVATRRLHARGSRSAGVAKELPAHVPARLPCGALARWWLSLRSELQLIAAPSMRTRAAAKEVARSSRTWLKTLLHDVARDRWFPEPAVADMLARTNKPGEGIQMRAIAISLAAMALALVIGATAADAAMWPARLAGYSTSDIQLSSGGCGAGFRRTLFGHRCVPVAASRRRCQQGMHPISFPNSQGYRCVFNR